MDSDEIVFIDNMFYFYFLMIATDSLALCQTLSDVLF